MAASTNFKSKDAASYDKVADTFDGLAHLYATAPARHTLLRRSISPPGSTSSTWVVALVLSPLRPPPLRTHKP